MKLKWRIIIPVFILLLLQGILIVSKEIKDFSDNTKRTIDNVASLKYSTFNGHLSKYYERGDVFLDFVLNDNTTLEYFTQRDREALADHTREIYNNFKDKIAMSQFQFHLPPATSFLRMHKESKYGDDLSKVRKTVVNTNNEKKQQIGLETGPWGMGMRVVKPVFYKNRHIGSVEYGGDINNEFLEKFESSATDAAKEYGLNITIVSKNLEGKFLLKASNFESEIQDTSNEILEKLEKGTWYQINGGKIDYFYPLKDFSDDTIGYIKLNFDIRSILGQRNKSIVIAIILNIIIIVILTAFIYAAITFILEKNLNKFIDLFSKTALGDLTVSFPLKKVNCSKVLQCGKTSCPEYDKKGVLCWFDVGSYAPDFGKKIHCPKILTGKYKTCAECKVYKMVNKNEILTLGAWFNKFLEVLKNQMNKIVESSNTIASGSEELSATMTQIQSSTDELNTSVTRISSAVEEMNSTTQHIYENTDTANNEASNSVSLAAEGKNEVIETGVEMKNILGQLQNGIDSLNNLNQHINSIGEIITVINEIASQTNLLSLNAAIEAARAGEAGKGFEVVAEEVRKLADKTTDSTDEIESMIKNIQNASRDTMNKMLEVNESVENGERLSSVASTKLETIVANVDSLKNMVAMIANSTQEQAVATDEIAGQSEQVLHNSNMTATNIKESVYSINDIANVASSLKEVVEYFQLGSNTKGLTTRKK